MLDICFEVSQSQFFHKLLFSPISPFHFIASHLRTYCFLKKSFLPSVNSANSSPHECKKFLSLFSPSSSFFTYCESSPSAIEFFYEILVSALKHISNKYPSSLTNFPEVVCTLKANSKSSDTSVVDGREMPLRSQVQLLEGIEGTHFACHLSPPTPFQLLVETTRIIKSYSCPECSNSAISSSLSRIPNCDCEV
jgi:hypothetical protein